jgi:hypothetical protein
MIKDLPDEATLNLGFYNFYSGYREWEKFFILTKGDAVEGDTKEYDLMLAMHSKYLTILNNNNLCSVIKTAQNNGDFYTETDLSTPALLWKFGGMMEYKDCLGL